MRLLALLMVVILSTIALGAQVARRPPSQENVDLAIGGVAIGADYAGRESLCVELRLMSTRAKNVRVLPQDAELLCRGGANGTFSLVIDKPPSSVDQFICEVASQPSTLVFYQMRPIALKSSAAVTSPEELSEKLQPLGVRPLGDLLAAFGFVDLRVRLTDSEDPVRQIGVHELGLLCAG